MTVYLVIERWFHGYSGYKVLGVAADPNRADEIIAEHRRLHPDLDTDTDFEGLVVERTELGSYDPDIIFRARYQ